MSPHSTSVSHCHYPTHESRSFTVHICVTMYRCIPWSARHAFLPLGSFQPATARFNHSPWLLTLCTGCPVLLLATLWTLHALLSLPDILLGCLALPQMCPACYAHAQVTLQHLRQHISLASACLMGNSFLCFTVMPSRLLAGITSTFVSYCRILARPYLDLAGELAALPTRHKRTWGSCWPALKCCTCNPLQCQLCQKQ